MSKNKRSDRVFHTNFTILSLALLVFLLVSIIGIYAQLVESYRRIGQVQHQLLELELEWLHTMLQGRDPLQVAQLDQRVSHFRESSALARLGMALPDIADLIDELERSWRELRLEWSAGSDTSGSETAMRGVIDAMRSWVEGYAPRQLRGLRVVLWMLLGVLLALVMALYWLLRSLEAARRREIYDREFAEAILQAQDTERRMLAYDIHDDVLQRLAAAQIALDRNTPDSVATASALLADTAAGMRELASGLNLHDLEEHGLVVALQTLGNYACTQYSLPVSVRISGLESLQIPLSVQRHVYRVAQECLANAYRHAAAENVSLSLVGSSPYLILQYRDDGVGLDADACSLHPSGFGLQSIRERARLLNARLAIESREAKGASIRLVIPLDSFSS